MSLAESKREIDGATRGAAPTYLLEVEGVRKAFPGVLALDNVSFRLKPGTVHALMGENGAGKSTLMKIIAGVYTPDAGSFKLRGQEVRLTSPLDALEQGVAMIHQELNLMAYMTVAENIWIRREPVNSLGLINHAEMRRKTVDLFKRLNIDLDPDAEVRDLSVANRQMVEIAKAVSYESDILILDEPTSALMDREVAHLFKIIRDLRAQGKGMVYITHKMNELYEIADEVSIFRDGHYVSTHASKDVTRDDIIRMMVGREITQMFPKETVPIGDTVLSVKNLSLQGVFQDVSFDLHAGEILGFAGLVGAGRSNVAETIFGVTPATSGTIEIHGQKVVVDQPMTAMKNGIAFLTEDRKETGCFLLLEVLDNMQVAVINGDFKKGEFLSYGFVAEKMITDAAERMRERLRVRTPDVYEPVVNLSGGNQQKVLVARWLLTKPKILILDEPTRGIDVGAKSEIHRLITNLAGQGVAVIMISSEMPEVLGMSDRIMVMREGKVRGFLDRKDANQVSVMQLAAN
jgi:inositol transport system ATP-binding protein